jgi:hypothetical protein
MQRSDQRDQVIGRVKKLALNVYPEIGDFTIVSDFSSYTRDKKVIHLCVFNPLTGEYYDDKTLLFVVLHELAHMISDSYSVGIHNTEFNTNFDMLRQRAYKMGYLPLDFNVTDLYCKLPGS